jgi:protein tyrosine phosphatase (PTP) superfamily phosphohydrolase (DUF442 family)
MARSPPSTYGYLLGHCRTRTRSRSVFVFALIRIRIKGRNHRSQALQGLSPRYPIRVN